jgi:hypothetical protein
MYLKWGTVEERERGWGGKKRGKVSTQATWDEGEQESHHTPRRDSK